MKRNKQTLKAARRAKTRPQWEAKRKAEAEAAARAAVAREAFNPVMRNDRT